jgi:hypothetical protein
LRIYLDACCLSRLTDDQSQARVHPESDAIEHILRMVRAGLATWVIVKSVAAGWVLKGGYALELRFLHARATKDIDLTLASGMIPAATAEEQQRPAWICSKFRRAIPAGFLRVYDWFRNP